LRANIVLCVDREFPFPVEFLCYPTHYLSDRTLYGNIQQYHWVRIFEERGENRLLIQQLLQEVTVRGSVHSAFPTLFLFFLFSSFCFCLSSLLVCFYFHLCLSSFIYIFIYFLSSYLSSSIILSFFSFSTFFGGRGGGGGMKHNSFPAQAEPKIATAKEILWDVDF